MLKIFYLIMMLVIVSTLGTACAKKEQASSAQITEKENEDKVLTQTPIPTQEVIKGNSPWKLLSESDVTTSVHYAAFIDQLVGVTIGYEGAVSFTKDGGKTWTVSEVTSSCRYGVDFVDPSFLITSGNTGVNMCSKDGGKTWSKLSDFPLKENSAFNKFMSIIDKENYYIGASKALGVTKNGGETWEEIALPKECNKLVGMFFLTTDTGYLLGVDGTLFITEDGCKTWTKQKIELSGDKILNSPMPAVAIQVQKDGTGSIVYTTKDYKVKYLVTKDKGINWEEQSMDNIPGQAPYLSRNGKYLTLSSPTKRINVYQLQEN